ncbi:hypothetical protein D3C72_1701640 [compost metagenome]
MQHALNEVAHADHVIRAYARAQRGADVRNGNVIVLGQHDARPTLPHAHAGQNHRAVVGRPIDMNHVDLLRKNDAPQVARGRQALAQPARVILGHHVHARHAAGQPVQAAAPRHGDGQAMTLRQGSQQRDNVNGVAANRGTGVIVRIKNIHRIGALWRAGITCRG